ncbi:DUF4878 domain-containing protein [Gordonia sp. CPCC 205333]|uniref:DUF4878 domain-containing protein n=1 Tax=Gordonia sp. CPCC 205333 TaxID=3140790 RepID=UPI003AF3A6FA
MNLRKTAAAAAIVGAAVFGVAACSNSEEASDTTGTTPSVVTDSSTTSAAAAELSAADAQVTLRKAIDPKTSSADLDAVVDTTNSGTKAALQLFAKGASMGGYTPEIFTVKSVAADGADKAVATVSVASPHAPQPVDIKLTYVKTDDGAWKLSADAVTQLSSMAGGHGH